MDLKFLKRYKSISKFETVNLPDFTVFVGQNGAGKTHLLESITNGNSKVDLIEADAIKYFSFSSFFLAKQNAVSIGNLISWKENAWNYLLANNSQIYNLDAKIKNIIEKDGDIGKSPYSQRFEDQAVQTSYDNLIRTHFSNLENNRKVDAHVKLIIKGVLRSTDKYISEVTKEEFENAVEFLGADYGLLNNLSQIFLEYKRKMILMQLPEEHGGSGATKTEIADFESQSPWNLINSILSSFGLDHSVSVPDIKAAEMFGGQLSFETKLKLNDEEIDFLDLSSGEKVLCALAITLYQGETMIFPDLILLDEIDASLHPSMIRHLLNVIEDVFISRGTKVMLATHSPTTTSLVDEASLYQVLAGSNEEKIVKVGQINAIDLLSEGIISFSEGLQIQRQVEADKQLFIVSEGNNFEHIRKALEMLSPDLLTKVKLIELPAESSCEKLRNAYLVMQAAPMHSKFLYVWDCDFKSKVDQLKETEELYKFAFDVNVENTKAVNTNREASGIENLYPDELFSDEVYVDEIKSTPHGKEFTVPQFKKELFKKKVIAQTDPTVFEKYKPLIEKIKQIID